MTGILLNARYVGYVLLGLAGFAEAVDASVSRAISLVGPPAPGACMTPTFGHLAILDLDELEALKVMVRRWLDRRGTEPSDVPTPTVPKGTRPARAALRGMRDRLRS